MAHVIKLKYGSPASWAYIDLTDVNHGNVDYIPGTPGEGAEEITESGVWRIAGSSVADLLAKIAEIEQAFYKAGQYSLDEIGAYQVRITIQPDGVAETWESQVFEGRLELSGNIMGVGWANRVAEVVLIWRRAGWWERYANLALTNSNGTSSPGTGLRVYNSGDSSGTAPTKRENWGYVTLTADQGDLPAAAVIKISALPSMDRYDVFSNSRSRPTDGNIFEGETGLGDTIDAARSAGKYHNYLTPVGGSAGIDVIGSELGTGMHNLVDGAWIRVILSAKFAGTVYARPYIAIGSARYYGPKSALVGNAADFYLYDLGMIHIPAIDANGYAAEFADGFTTFYFSINLIAATAITVAVDYFEYIPMDSYAKGAMDIPTGGLVVIDSRSGSVLGNQGYGINHSLSSAGTLYGGLWLEPNATTKLTFKMTELGLDHMDHYAAIEVDAWLRKRTI
jgi:hypothetical protein